jgi:FkbM family methyltransferase
MYQAHGWWFPDQDTHFAELLSRNVAKGKTAVYQQPVRQQSINLTPYKTLALDIGANVGLWSRDLTHVFDRVIAFEPVSEFRDCLIKNVPAKNLEIRPYALGAEDTFIDMIITAENTGHSHVDISTMGHGTTPMYRLDSLELPKIDYIKIDCEGYENTILRGAQETIMRDRPIMVVEHKRHKDVGHDDVDLALDTLISWGASILTHIKNDYVLGWN